MAHKPRPQTEEEKVRELEIDAGLRPAPKPPTGGGGVR